MECVVGNPKPYFNGETKMSDGGKGSTPRPFSVSNQEYADRWNAIFGKIDSETDKPTRNNEETQQVQNSSLDSSGKSLV